MDEISRRQLLKTGSMSAFALTTIGKTASVARAAASSTALGANQLKTLRALVDALDRPGRTINARSFDFVGGVNDRYRSAPTSYRDRVDSVLATLDEGSVGRFAGLTPNQRRAQLASWTRLRDPQDDRLTAAPRPTDASDPDDLRAANATVGLRIQQNRARIESTTEGRQSLENDAVTGLPTYTPVSGPSVLLPAGGPFDTETKWRRYVSVDAHQLLSEMVTEGANVGLEGGNA